MSTGYYSGNWKIFLIIFLAIVITIGAQEIFYISDYVISNYFDNGSNVVGDLERISFETGNFLGNILYKSYNFIYFDIFNIPIVFWLLIAINLFLIFVLKLENIKSISQSIFAAYNINKGDKIKQKYDNFRDFICSSYGAVSIAAVSEIAILLRNYNTLGSIFWMCLTILLIGFIQLCEIILNCHYVENSGDNSSCFVCVLQYVATKYSKFIKNDSTVKKISIFIGLYGIVMILISFFSATLFQIEQIGNIFVMSGSSYEDIIKFLSIGLVIIFFVVSFNHFRVALRINNKIVTPMIVVYLLAMFLFLFMNSGATLNSIAMIFDDILNPSAILPGVVSGLVISFARYIYKKYQDGDDEHSSVYEDTNLVKASVMYTVESFFMMFLVVVTGVAFFIAGNMDYNFFGVNVTYLISIFLVFFGISVIFNEAIYSRVVLVHIIKYREIISDWIVRIVLLFGVFFGLFPETDSWVDIADHLSIIFLILNIISFFLLRRDTKNMFDSYKAIS
jgi:Na+/alanine symporter